MTVNGFARSRFCIKCIQLVDVCSFKAVFRVIYVGILDIICPETMSIAKAVQQIYEVPRPHRGFAPGTTGADPHSSLDVWPQHFLKRAAAPWC